MVWRYSFAFGHFTPIYRPLCWYSRNSGQIQRQAVRPTKIPYLTSRRYVSTDCIFLFTYSIWFLKHLLKILQGRMYWRWKTFAWIFSQIIEKHFWNLNFHLHGRVLAIFPHIIIFTQHTVYCNSSYLRIKSV